LLFRPRRRSEANRAKGLAKISGNFLFRFMDSLNSLHHQRHGHRTTNEEFRDIGS
jgi:hypothetical protein